MCVLFVFFVFAVVKNPAKYPSPSEEEVESRSESVLDPWGMPNKPKLEEFDEFSPFSSEKSSSSSSEPLKSTFRALLVLFLRSDSDLELEKAFFCAFFCKFVENSPFLRECSPFLLNLELRDREECELE